MTDGTCRLEVGILGPFEVCAAAGPIAIRGATERALLARLAIDGNRPVSNARIAEDLWGDQPPQRPKQAIHALVFRLRRALGEAAPALQTGEQGYSLRLGADGLDLWRFEALAARGRRAHIEGDLDGAARQLAAALGLWRGDPLAGVGDFPFASSRGRRLDEMRFEALAERTEVDLARGLHARLIPELEALALERPEHEGICRLLMIALYRSGRQVDALAVYDRLRKRLAGHFGIDPSPPLAELEVQVLRQDPKLAWRAPVGAGAPPSPRLEPGRGSLPHPLTSFIGRETELAEVIALVARHRLVTIAGPGGCGKTRLVIAAGHRLAAGHEVRFVRLDGLGDGDLVAASVAEALGIRLGTGGSAMSKLTEALAGRDVLVILDNCEHLLQSCADLVIAVLEAAPSVRFLLTTREPLGIPGEAVWRLRSLAAPLLDAPEDAVESSDSVRLFVDRATAAMGSAGHLGRAELPAIAGICRRLDGIPLAIELAAARMVTLSLDQLSRRLADRFAVLDAGSRTTLPRHRTLLAAMTWSHDLLDERERSLFRRLAVFASAFPLEAAETVCAGGGIEALEVCDLLARLVAKSLVTVERDEGEVGYRLLSTIREYAGSWLTDGAERDELSRRHHDWCLGQATQASRVLRGGDQPYWSRRIGSCIDDIRAALDWALGASRGASSGPSSGTSRGASPGEGALAAAMWPVWEMRGQDREGRQWLSRALARVEPSPTLERATLLLGASVFAKAADDFDESRQLLEEATAIYGGLGHVSGIAQCRLEEGRRLLLESRLDSAERCAAEARQQYCDLANEWGVAWSDVLAGNAAMVRGDYEAASRVLGAALAAGRGLDNAFIVGETTVFLGLVALRGGQVSQAGPYFEEALRIGRMLGSDALVNVSLANLGVLAGHEGDHGRALALLDEALEMAKKRGEPLAVARILLESGEIASRRGEHFRSQALANDALRVYRGIGTFSPVPQCLDVLARASLSLGEIPRAATLLGAAAAARDFLGLTGPDHPASVQGDAQGTARGNEEWRRAWELGAQLSISGAIRLALGES